MGDKFQQPSILLVDDELSVCKTLSYLLKKYGFSVTEVSNGGDAIKLLENMSFDVVITDLLMEGVDGLGVVKAVKELAPFTSIIVMTGDIQFKNRLDVLSSGVEYILIKPFDIEELVSRIQSCLATKNILMQLITPNQVEKNSELDNIREYSIKEEDCSRLGKDMAIDQVFMKKILYLDLKLINESQDVIYIIDAKFILKAYNKAWVNFARSNKGEDVLIKYPIGSMILDAFQGPFKSYFTKKYNDSLEFNKHFEHNYKCPTAEGDRVFRQFAYPLKGSIGLVISNHLVLEKPHMEEPQEFTKQFVDDDGLIHQCSNCRKIKDPAKGAWLWVPSLLADPFPETSHGICPQCLDYFYPEIE